MADLDGDGCLDMISGSYWPGEIWIFRGTKSSAFEKGDPIKDADGRVLHAGAQWKSEEEPERDSLAAAPFAYDHDVDGDLDLLVGNISGRVILIRNDGTRNKPAFGKSKEPVQVGGKPIEVPGGDAGPTIADWDQDGKLDLLVDAGDGSVWWFRNTDARSKPAYAQGVAIIAGDENIIAVTAGPTPARSGTRLKPHVVDYDGDGRLDLLVGDYTYKRRPAPQLTAAQTEKRDTLKRRLESLEQEALKLRAKPRDDPERKRLWAEGMATYEELAPLEEGWETHGWVWLYRRKPM